MIMKLHTLTPHESRMCPIDFGVKRSTVKVMAHGYLKMVHRNNGCRFEFVGVGGVKRSKVKVMAHGYLKMVSGR